MRRQIDKFAASKGAGRMPATAGGTPALRMGAEAELRSAEIAEGGCPHVVRGDQSFNAVSCCNCKAGKEFPERTCCGPVHSQAFLIQR